MGRAGLRPARHHQPRIELRVRRPPGQADEQGFFFTREVPISSALGYSQAIDGTWEWYLRDTGRRRADRTRFADASDFIGWYMNLNTRVNGIPTRDAYNQYLAYHDGQAGYARGSYRAKPWLPPVARDVAGLGQPLRATASDLPDPLRRTGREQKRP